MTAHTKTVRAWLEWVEVTAHHMSHTGWHAKKIDQYTNVIDVLQAIMFYAETPEAEITIWLYD